MNNSFSIGVTGASGFVGYRLVEALAQKESFSVTAFTRSESFSVSNVKLITIKDMSSLTSSSELLQDLDCLIHCAARVHIMNDTASDPLAEFRRVNVDSTLALARKAAAAGINRFIFISSIKVNGEETLPGQPYKETDTPKPNDPYGISKLEAESGLFKIGEETGMQIVIIRPVLVYGPGVKANFRSMMNWLLKGIPIPLASIRNKRSLVALDNLIDLIVTCITHPAASNEVFLVSDGEDLSTPDLLRKMAISLNCPLCLLPFPVSFLHFGATLIGKRAFAKRLCGSLQVDISKAKRILDWTPPISTDVALKSTANALLFSERS